MASCVRFELNRWFRSVLFFTVLLIGLACSAINLLESLQRAAELKQLNLEAVELGMEINPSCTGFSLFTSWIALHPTGSGSMLFYLILPILSAIPYGWSYCWDRKTGYYHQVITRMGRKSYFAAKNLAVFISGGLAAGLPVLMDLLACAMFLPDRAVRVSDNLLPILNYALGARLLYTNRWWYTVLWCGLTFLWGGAFSCLCILPGTRFRLGTLTVLTPFAVVLAADALIRSVGEVLERKTFSILELPRPGSTSFSPGWAVILILILLMIQTLAVGYWRMVKHELE
mgnify:FL=1